MNYVLLLSAALLFSACNGFGDRDRPSATSSGQPFELLVVHDGDTSVQDAILRVFGQPYPALPQPEPWFNLRFLHIDNLVNLHKRQRKILFAGSFEQNNRLAEIIGELFGEENVREILQHPERFYTSARDIWARPQMVVAFFDHSHELLAKKIETNANFLLNQFDAAETRRFRNLVFTGPQNERAVRRLENKHKIGMRVPPLFNIAEDFLPGEDKRLEKAGINGFLWLRGETDKSNQEILIYYIDYISRDQFTVENILAIRDSVGKYFIPGPAENSFMQTEHRYIPQTREIDLNGQYAVETRGLWRTEGDFMGGPFVNYVLYDESAQRVVFAEGFVYAPEARKRDFVKRLEVTLKSIRMNGEQ